jgi:hypothetical protein
MVGEVRRLLDPNASSNSDGFRVHTGDDVVSLPVLAFISVY